MNRIWFAAPMSFVVALAAVHTAGAATVYRYTGDRFNLIADDDPPSGTYTSQDRVTATLEMSAPLAANLDFADATSDLISYLFSDGRSSLTTGLGLGFFSTDSSGEITEWLWSVGQSSDPKQILTRSASNNMFFDSGLIDSGAGFDLGQVTAAGSAGRWRLVPEPGTAALLVVGLGLLAARSRATRHL